MTAFSSPRRRWWWCSVFFPSFWALVSRKDTHMYTHTHVPNVMHSVPPSRHSLIYSPFMSLPFLFHLPSFIQAVTHSLPSYFLSTRGPTLSPHFLLCSVCEPSHKGKVLLRQQRHMATTPFLSFFIRSSMSALVWRGRKKWGLKKGSGGHKG